MYKKLRKNKKMPVGASLVPAHLQRDYHKTLNNTSKSGITLIALILTIIILLILAMVSISYIMRENIIKHAETAADQYQTEAEKEAIELAYGEYVMESLNDENASLKMEKEAESVTGNKTTGWTVTFPSGNVYTVDTRGNITGPKKTSNTTESDMIVVGQTWTNVILDTEKIPTVEPDLIKQIEEDGNMEGVFVVINDSNGEGWVVSIVCNNTNFPVLNGKCPTQLIWGYAESDVINNPDYAYKYVWKYYSYEGNGNKYEYNANTWTYDGNKDEKLLADEKKKITGTVESVIYLNGQNQNSEGLNILLRSWLSGTIIDPAE